MLFLFLVLRGNKCLTIEVLIQFNITLYNNTYECVNKQTNVVVGVIILKKYDNN